jgi:hypothetical protein
VGHAIFQTARAMGPSTIDRSNLRAVPVPGAADCVVAGVPGVSSAEDPVWASAVEGAVESKKIDHNKLPGLLQDAPDLGVRHDDGRLPL